MKQICCYNSTKPSHLARNCRNKNRPIVWANLPEEELNGMIT